MKKGPPEGHFTAFSEVEAAEVCEQLRDVWRQRNLTFEDCWSDQRESFEEVGVKEVSGQVEQGIESQERVKLEDLQKEASVVVTRPEGQAEGASLRQHHNVAEKDVKDEKQF